MRLSDSDYRAICAALKRGESAGLYLGGTFGCKADESGALAPYYSAEDITAFHAGGAQYFSLKNESGAPILLDSIDFVRERHYAGIKAALLAIAAAAPAAPRALPVIFGTDTAQYYAKLFAFDDGLQEILRKKKLRLVFIVAMRTLNDAPLAARRLLCAAGLAARAVPAGVYMLSPADAEASRVAVLDCALPLEKISADPARCDALQSAAPVCFIPDGEALPGARASRRRPPSLSLPVLPLGRGNCLAAIIALAQRFPNSHIAISGAPPLMGAPEARMLRRAALMREKRCGSRLFFCNGAVCATLSSRHGAPDFRPPSPHAAWMRGKKIFGNAPGITFIDDMLPEELALSALEAPVPKGARPADYWLHLKYAPTLAWAQGVRHMARLFAGVAVETPVGGAIAGELLRGLPPACVKLGPARLSDKTPRYAAGGASAGFMLSGRAPEAFAKAYAAKKQRWHK